MNIDFHAHILPGVDHGCSNIESAVKYLDFAKKMGVDIVVSTSHFYPHIHTVDKFIELRDKVYSTLVNNIDDIKYPLIIPAAEVLLCNNIHKMDKLEKLCIYNTNVLLVEMPFGRWEEDIFNTLCKLYYDKRFHIVMAHIDRYELSDVKKIIDMGIDVQINADYYHSMKKRKIVDMCIKANSIVAIGSDIHKDKKSYKDYNKVINKLKDIDNIMKKSRDLIGDMTCIK